MSEREIYLQVQIETLEQEVKNQAEEIRRLEQEIAWLKHDGEAEVDTPPTNG